MCWTGASVGEDCFDFQRMIIREFMKSFEEEIYSFMITVLTHDAAPTLDIRLRARERDIFLLS